MVCLSFCFKTKHPDSVCLFVCGCSQSILLPAPKISNSLRLFHCTFLQLTYSTSRFGVYEILRAKLQGNKSKLFTNGRICVIMIINSSRSHPVLSEDSDRRRWRYSNHLVRAYHSSCIDYLVGACGGMVGSPADMVNVR